MDLKSEIDRQWEKIIENQTKNKRKKGQFVITQPLRHKQEAKQSTPSLNSMFYFSYTSCFTTAWELRLLYYLHTAEQGKVKDICLSQEHQGVKKHKRLPQAFEFF